MEWLLHNPIADMYGPTFLLFYAGVVTATLVTCWLLVKKSDWTALMPTPAVPPSPDPYEIAYLREGESGVANAALFGLVQRGYLEVAEEKEGAVIRRAPEHPDPRLLTQLERRLFESFAAPRKALTAYGALGLTPEIKAGCQEYESKLRREHLLVPDSARRAARLVLYGGLFVIAGLGGYKLAVALWKGYTNVWFLVGMAVASVVLLGYLCERPFGRLSKRGEAYLKKLQTAYEQLGSRYRHAPSGAPAGAVAGFDPSMLLLVGLFGSYALAGTAYDGYYRSLYGSQHSASGGASGAGDGGSSSGGDSGGDSGGGGGGGCGGGRGGGCGGCGGD